MLHPQRPSKFRDGGDSPKRKPTYMKQNSSAKQFLKASPNTEKPKKKTGRRPLRSSSTKELDNKSFNSFAELEDLQNLYHKQLKDVEKPSSRILTDLTPNKKIAVHTQVKQIYYSMLRKKLTRNATNNYPDTSEFIEQIQEIKDNLRTPNAERVKDLVIIDKTPLEKLKTYNDKYPLLRTRKAILKFKRYFNYL